MAPQVEDQALSRDELRKPFLKLGRTDELIGIEVEMALVDPDNGRSFAYDTDRGARRLLQTMLATGDWLPIHDGGNLIELQAANGDRIKVEHGGAVEYCSPPMRSVVSLIDQMRRTIGEMAATARSLGAALLGGAYMPFNRFADTRWTPNPRADIMRDYFANLGERSQGAAPVMALATSTQATIDYVSEEDLCRKLRCLAAVSPVASAMFLNSPLDEGRPCGVLSRRTQLYLATDPSRSGPLPPAFGQTMSLDDFIDWALELPMIFRAQGGRYLPVNGLTFAEINRHGFADGTRPVLSDWVMHCAPIFTDTRVRSTIELRGLDGPAYCDLPSVPAFWTGLAYHPDSLREATELVAGISLSECRRAQGDILRHGLEASYGQHRTKDLVAELVRLARQGLEARCRSGIEEPRVLSFLDPLEETLRSGQTPAQRQLDWWRGELGESPAKFVDKFRI